MTAPSRQNGRPVEVVARMCANKNRYPDEYTARAAGMHYRAQRNETSALFVYRCPACAGYHLTRARHPERQNVEYDFSRHG